VTRPALAGRKGQAGDDLQDDNFSVALTMRPWPGALTHQSGHGALVTAALSLETSVDHQTR